MPEPTSCVAAGCGQPSVATLDLRPLCFQHFIAGSYSRLEEMRGRGVDPADPAEATAALWAFVTDCSRQVMDLAQRDASLGNLGRAQLLDILLHVSELAQRLRRSPRLPIAVDVRIRCEVPGQLWEEQTETRMLSRCGALVEFRHAVQVGDMLMVSRPDTGQEATARVAWFRRRSDGVQEIGIELLNCENFWALDWSEAATTP
jgi:hypothetical protein